MPCWLEQKEGLFIDVVTAESEPLSFYMYVAFSILICDAEKMCVEVYLILMSASIRFC